MYWLGGRRRPCLAGKRVHIIRSESWACVWTFSCFLDHLVETETRQPPEELQLEPQLIWLLKFYIKIMIYFDVKVFMNKQRSTNHPNMIKSKVSLRKEMKFIKKKLNLSELLIKKWKCSWVQFYNHQSSHSLKTLHRRTSLHHYTTLKVRYWNNILFPACFMLLSTPVPSGKCYCRRQKCTDFCTNVTVTFFYVTAYLFW